MSTTSEISYIETIIDLLLAVLSNIDLGYLGYRPYTLEQETILQIINHVRGTLMYYTIGLPRAVAPHEGNSKGKVAKNMKRSRSKCRCGGVTGGSEDDDYEAQAGSPVVLRAMDGSKCSSPSSSSSCALVEVVPEVPVPTTISSSSSSSSSSDDDAEWGYAGGQTGLTSSSESSESEEDENTGAGGANP
jgi:hypothetical protein